jgi:hypothetical protein
LLLFVLIDIGFRDSIAYTSLKNLNENLNENY